MKYARISLAGRFRFAYSVHPFNLVSGRNRPALDGIGSESPRKVSPTLVLQRLFRQRWAKRSEGERTDSKNAGPSPKSLGELVDGRVIKMSPEICCS